MKQERTVQGVSGNLFNRCRNTLLQCGEFDSDASLRAVLVTSKLRPFRDRLPKAADRSERVDRCLAFLLNSRHSDGCSVLPTFLEALRDRYQPGDVLRDELASLAEDIRADLSSSGGITIVPNGT